jgi:hypothetical protein
MTLTEAKKCSISFLQAKYVVTSDNIYGSIPGSMVTPEKKNDGNSYHMLIRNIILGYGFNTQQGT